MSLVVLTLQCSVCRLYELCFHFPEYLSHILIDFWVGIKVFPFLAGPLSDSSPLLQDS